MPKKEKKEKKEKKNKKKSSKRAEAIIEEDDVVIDAESGETQTTVISTQLEIQPAEVSSEEFFVPPAVTRSPKTIMQ